ncbi:hypothetical protein KP509_29G078600 [Ceratopteris richardii]|uniref:F-box domain-containing protein n=1 Tax=Ceratopteris richardii TaxID=49495 RepID=A0A8T2R8F6_CERRI|nr:hypothetical protein KP509_29G078600 [Ceratopteris richardii]KAH7292639.1 hypothetical protein KP509_29G078600 [Ceratopteris richardii]KAH7292640.1 hypothetical protein KP509_29G078600 [Ceratopteris richardii]KAH7292641.1 hypothetical protein KP509_29G078600 [Ceratopteris richardii]
MGKSRKRARKFSGHHEEKGQSSTWSAQLDITERPETGEEDSFIGILSDDSIAQILRNLPTRFLLSSSVLVCRRWKRVCSNLLLDIVPSPLSAYNLPWTSLGEDEICGLAMRHNSTLECIHFSRPKEPTFEKVTMLTKSLPHLMDFGMISCSLTESKLEGLLDALPGQLTALDLHNDHILDGDCDEDGLNTSAVPLDTFLLGLSKKCSKLRRLDLDFCSQISSAGLDGLLCKIPHMQMLHLQSSTIGWPEVYNVFQSCTFMKSLSITSRRLFEEPDTSDEDERVIHGRQSRPRARVPSHSFSQYMNPGPLVCPHLQSIRFYSATHHSVPLDSIPLVGLLKNKGHQLQELHAQSLYNTSWHMISVHCANLKVLDLSHARAMPYSATGVEEVVLCGLFRILKFLERIGLPSVTNRILLDIGRSCSKLKELRCEGYASRSGSIPRRSEVTDLGVVAIAEGCPDLQVLSLAGCVAISIASLRALAFHCQILKVLILSDCTKINDDAIAAVWPRIGRKLCVLDVVGCKITAKTIRMFYQIGLMQETSLVVLSISRSLSKSAKSELLELCEGLPSLQLIKTMSGLPWDGFFGSHSFDELIPRPRTVKKSS